MMALTKLLLSFLGLATLPFTLAQCPNEVALYNPNVRTGTENGTWFLVPINSSAVQTALDQTYGTGVVLLATVPRKNRSLFPHGFPKDKHPVLVQSFLVDDIRMSAAEIDGPLLEGAIDAPYTRRPQSKPGTILTALISSYMAGPDNDQVSGLVPSTVSTTIEGYPTRLGKFIPDDAGYQLNSGGVFSNNVAWQIAPNPVSGPGIYPESFDIEYKRTAKFGKYPALLFKTMLNQPSILSGAYLANNTCQRNQLYYNNATGVMLPRVGNVTLGPGASGASIATSSTLQNASAGGYGFFGGLEGFSACAQNVGFNPQDCDQASKDVDKSAL